MSIETVSSQAQQPSAPPTANINLGQRAMRGLLWVVASTVGTKLVSFGGQLVVAWLLVPRELGVVALAYSVTAFTTILQKNGLREILVQRGPRFGLYVNAAFWMSLGVGLTVAALTLAAAPLAAQLYRDPRLLGILAVLALSAPLLALQGVPSAQLQSEMRFRALSGFAVFESIALTALTVLFAWRGFGAYSVVLPAPIVQAASAAGMFLLTRPTLHLRLDRQHWPELFTQSGLMLGASALYAFNLQGANMVLGVFHDAATVGVFFFAYNLVGQLTGLVANNLWYVLLPSFSQLQDDPARLNAVFLRVVRLSNVVGMPVCFLLAAVAEPAVRVCYGTKWEGAIPAMQVLSLGMTMNISFSLSLTLMLSQGRFEFLFNFNVYRAAAFLLLVTLGAWQGGVLAVSIATAIFVIIFGPLATHAAVRPGGSGWAEVWRAHAVPLLLGAVAGAAAWGAAVLVPVTPRREWAQIVVASLTFALVYVPLLRWLLPAVWLDLVTRLGGLRRRVA